MTSFWYLTCCLITIFLYSTVVKPEESKNFLHLGTKHSWAVLKILSKFKFSEKHWENKNAIKTIKCVTSRNFFLLQHTRFYDGFLYHHRTSGFWYYLIWYKQEEKDNTEENRLSQRQSCSEKIFNRLYQCHFRKWNKQICWSFLMIQAHSVFSLMRRILKHKT